MPKTGAGKRASDPGRRAFFDGQRSRAAGDHRGQKSQPGKGALNELKKVFQNRDRATVL
jgi:hypothetical protein